MSDNKVAELRIDECRRHGFTAIFIGDENGGDRLTPDKCCGTWTTRKVWKMNAAELRELATTILHYADRLDVKPLKKRKATP